jgi:hypothetical protein
VYAACSDYVVGFVVGKVWRIVPCVYKIYTLGGFHGFIRNIPIRCWGGNVYREEEVCISGFVTL